MKRTYLFLLAAALTNMAAAQTLKEWDDVNVNSLNRQRAHTLDVPVPDATAASMAYTPTNALEASPYVLSLNGTWKFKWVGTPEQANNNFYKDSFDASAWDDIEVPSAWQVYGMRNGKAWDKPLYVNVSYPFSYNDQTWSVMADRPGWFTYRDQKKNPVGSYRREFTLPDNWDGRDVFLRFNGCGHGYYVWVNGLFVGYAEDSYLPSEWNVTDKLHEGVNNISVRVYRFTSGSFLECQDYWRLTGITRDVFLWSAPKTRIHDFFFRTTELRSENTEASAQLTVSIGGKTPSNATLTAELKDGAQVLASKSLSVTKTGDLDLSFDKISGITAWSAELPKLYDLVLTLKEGAATTDIRALKVGLRTVSVRKDGALLVNGNPVIFHGVDRHDFSEKGGRTVTKEEMETDLLQMKRLNVNGVRTSHYPNNPYLYDLCDRLGIYVLAEANVECHGNMGLSSIEAFRPAMTERSVRHVLTFRNHPAIIIWSAGNESGGGDNFRSVMDSIGRLDPTRLTHYEGNSTWSSVTSTMYGNIGHMESIGRDRLNDYNNGKTGIRPHVQCENTHAMGNSMGNQREFFELYEKYPALCGEFVWDWKDQGLKMSASGRQLTFEAKGREQKTDILSTLNPRNGEYWAYGGDYGDNPNDGNFCCNGVVLADVAPTSKSYNMKKIYQPVAFKLKSASAGIFTLTSKLQQRVLNDVNIAYTIEEDGIEVANGKLNDVSLGIGESIDVTIPEVKNIVANPRKPTAEYFIRFSATQKYDTEWANAGFEVATEGIQLRQASGRKPYASASDQQLTATGTASNMKISGANFAIQFREGQLHNYTLNGKQLLSAPLTFKAFRVPTDNEAGKAETYDNLGLRNLTLTPGKWEVNKAEDGKSITLDITNTYKGGGETKFIVQQHFLILNDGTVIVNINADPSCKGVELPRIGMRTELPSGTENMRWLGRGPWDSYRDRMDATHVGLYHSTVDAQWTNFVKPQETGNKEDVRWMALTNDDGRGMLFVAPERMAASAGHWRAEEVYTNRNDRKKHPNEVPFCQPTVVNLDAYQRALGNASCGPDVLDKYKIRAAKTLFSFLMIPLAEAQTDEQLAERARVASPVCSPVEISASKGTVTLNTTDKDATIHYSIDGGEEKTYTAPFQLTKGGTVRAYSTADNRQPSPVNEEVIGMYVDKSKWTVLSVSSEQGGNEAAKNVIDENPSTIWHTQYNPQKPTCPHEIVVDMKSFYKVAKFVYQGREDMGNGRIAKYEFYVSTSSTVWGAPVAHGTLQNNSEVQEIDIPSRPVGRYFRLIVQSTHDNQGYASAAELGIIPEEEASRPDLPSAVFNTSTSNYYYLRHKASGLYLHYVEGKTEDAFALGEVTENNLEDYSYRFQFGKVNKYTAYYTLKTRQPVRQMTINGWHVNGTESFSATDHACWMLVEQLPTETIRLRGAEHGMEYLNFDKKTPGSLVYADKSTGAEFEVIRQSAIGDAVPVADIKAYDNSRETVYDLNGRKLGTASNGHLPVDKKGIYITQNGKKTKKRSVRP